MTKPKRYKRYSAEFKKEAIRRATEEGVTDKAVVHHPAERAPRKGGASMHQAFLVPACESDRLLHREHNRRGREFPLLIDEVSKVRCACIWIFWGQQLSGQRITIAIGCRPMVEEPKPNLRSCAGLHSAEFPF